MVSNALRWRALIFAVLFVVVFALVTLPFWPGFSFEKGEPLFTVVFLDIGQGDAIFIETPDGQQMLIDGGPGSAILRELPKHMSIFDRSIDVVLATHPDKDHVGGLVDVLSRYQVGKIIETENKNETAVSDAFSDYAKKEGAEIFLARAGQVLTLGASTTIKIFSPAFDPEDWESNASSIVAKVTYGEIDFLLTGDAPLNTEEYLVGVYGTELASEVLKLGHHGSRTSTSDLFLNTVRPSFAIVSAGRGNNYGHPHAEVVDRVLARGIILDSTIESGNIVFKSDGQRVWVAE
jgi:competence protein ComEC